MKQTIIDLKRRNLLKQSLFGLTALAAGTIIATSAYADELPELTEDDPMAIGLGYKKDTTTVDAAKQPRHTADQQCSNCALYMSKSETAGTCAIFAGKHVSATGWCSAYAKKA
ncbi:high-potential iron-sulfur protein [Neptunomonas antarctica]|uniref:High-potential iron-sulfur protein n=1 Tax=Neptunomonas antarctica TaxID=619304 RepID=A0A1N7NUX7_9GAMM|nr:high-potential iron-sulfur protein [Neptunomonas antarctica]SIT02092.1 High potential iron-sulfur protein [Neptunomonas antarctica]